MYYKEWNEVLLTWSIYDKHEMFVCECYEESTTDWLLSILNKL